jgi:atypical dual specificity phosphatase
MTKIGSFYRWFHGRVVTRPTNFSWIIEDKLAASGLPMTVPQLIWVIRKGIKTIISVREVPLPSEWLNNLGSKIDYFHLKVEDYGAPTLEQLDRTIVYIRSQIANRKPVMVHCAAGRGRTGTVLASFLLKEDYDLTADQAIQRIRKLRPGSIQSERQEVAVSMYEKYLKARWKQSARQDI